jgi:mono/diheme cytochrome c family protein
MRVSCSAGGLLVLLLVGCGGSSQEGAAAFRGFDPGPAPDSLRRGQMLYNTYCVSCHGLYGTGQGLGPPLLDTLYRPAQMPDEAVYQAVERGVKQRHWHYGAMPKLLRVEPAEVREIIPYLRWLQRQVEPAGAAPPGGPKR